ncbi:MAG: thermopsin family protease, partial [Thermoplasmata archaeon]
MNGSGRAKVWVAVGVVAVLVASSLGMWVFTGVAPGGSVPAGSNAPGSAGSPADVATSLNSAPASPAATPQTPATTGAQAAADRALAAAAADHISPRDVLPPRPSATSAEVASAHTAGYVSPLYHATPAPIGLTEYGLRAGANGTVVPFILNTTSVRSTFDSPAAGAANATYLVDSSPDGWGVQLNSVVTNVTLFGGSTYQFWTQDVAEYFPVAHQLYLVTNVWNFSGSSSVLSLNAFYNHGPLGQQVGTQFYYASYGPVTVSYPFNITFTLTSGLSGGRNIVDFSTNVVATHGSVSLPDWDYVTFNSRTATGPPVSSPANYTADGFHYNPLGLTNDFEMTMGGPGGGSQVTLLAANATETLDYWNATTSSYQAVPSAYSYGGETGETAVGATMSWASSGSSPYGIMSTGPSILGGLWNASSPAGGPATIDLHLHPSNAFVLLATSGASRSAFNVSETEWAPTVRISTLTVPAGNYTVTIELADYDLQTLHLTLAPGSVTDVYANLSLDPTQGIYTPLWAWTNAQIGNLSSSGAGTQNDPYQLWNNQYAPIAAFWGQLNDFGFQVFPGVFFEYTTAYAVFADPAPLTVDLVSAHYPATNALPWWFYGDRNVAVVNATNISGWFDAQASNYPYFLSFNVIVWNSSSFLFANDHFDTEAQALILYGGTGTTVWGSHFIQISPPASSHALVSFSQGIGVSEQENGDLLYNNYFTSPTTAETYPADLYSGAPATYTDTWNVSVQAATNVHHSANWPQFALSGSILGTATQGGNFWWDYGLVQTTYGTSNPFSTLPYSENGAIVVGGDSAPLLASGFYSVTLVAGGIASGAAWSFVASLPSSTQDEYDSGVTTSASVSIGLPNGSYLATGSSGVTPSVRTPFTVAGDTSVVLAFSSGTYAVAFGETGLPVATSWSVTLGGNTQHTRSSTIAFAEPNGTYGYTLGSVAGYVAYPSGGQVTVFGANPAPVAITFVAVHPVDYNVTFAASGLTGGATWSATINGETNSTSGATITFQEVNGSYPYEVASAAPWAPIVATGIVDVQGGDVATA